MADLRVKLTDGDNIVKTAFDAAAAIGLNLELDWPTSPKSDSEINVGNDDRFFSNYEYGSPINSMDIMESLSPYIECESLNALKSFKVSKHFNDKEAFKRSAKTAARSFRHKQRKHPQDSLPLLQPPGPLQEDTLYRGQLDNSTNIEKLKYRRKKRNSKSTRTYERDLKLQPDEGTTASDAVLTAKPLLKIDVPTRFMCLNSELAPTSPSYRRKISLIMNECPEDRQEFFKVFSCLLRMGNSAKQEKEKQLANNYNRQPSTEEQIWQNQLNDVIWLSLQAWFAGRTLEEQDQFLCIQRQAIVGGILEEIMQFHFSSHYSTLPSILEFVPHKQCPTDSLSPEYIAQQKDAVKQVTALLEKLESVEQLYPTLKAMAKDFELYGSKKFTRRVKTMCVWLNSTKELSHIMKVMAKVLGVKDLENINWPYRDFESTDSSVDQEDEEEDEDIEQDSVDGIHAKLSKANQDLLVDEDNDGVLERRKNSRKSVRFSTSAPPSEDCTDSDDFDNEMDLNLPSSPPSTSTPLKSVTSSSSMTSLSRSSSDISLDDQSRTAIYRHFVDKSLKQRGLRKILHRLHDLLNGTLQRARQALEKIPAEKKIGSKYSTVDPPPLSQDLSTIEIDDDENICQYGVWSEEFKLLGLPSFRSAYLFLLRIPLDIVHECIKLRLEQKPKSDPSFLSIRQLMYECKEVIKAAVEVKQLYQNMLQAVMCDELLEKETPDPNLEQFDDDVKEILEVYLHYLQSWILMLQNLTQASRSQKNVLEEEWSYTKEICPHIRGGEALAGKRFCFMASGLLVSIADFLETGIDEFTTHLYDSPNPESDFSLNMSSRQTMLQICRDFKELFHEARERALKALGFAKMLCKDLEIAADFNMTITCADLLEKLKETNHIRVIAPHSAGYLMFIPEHTAKNEQHILQLLNVTCGREDNSQTDMEGDEGYLLLVKCESGIDRAYSCPAWTGPVKKVEPTAETTIALSHIQVDGLLLVVIHSSRLLSQRKTFQRVMDNVVELVNEHTSCHQVIAESLNELKIEAIFLQEKIAKAIQQIDEKLSMDGMLDKEDNDKTNILKSYRETMHQCYNFGFEYYKEVTRLVTGDAKNKLGEGLISFSKQWMKFVLEKCDRGRGLRPRWANQGLDFLITACDPKYLANLTEKEFLELKQSINECVSHVIGSADKSPCLPISRATSPSILGLGKQVIRNHSWPESTKFNRSTSTRSDSQYSPSPFEDWKKRSSIDSQTESSTDISDCSIAIEVATEPKLPIERFRTRLEQLEKQRQNKLLESGVIGRVSRRKIDNVVHINARRVTFRWQRGIKVGEGRFGKVYTAVNMDTSEMMAIKELRFQPNDHQTIKEIADEIKTFEGILHPNLVKYYGVEVHREEMLIFMEYCDEGTLQEAARLGLPESMIRKYTRELVVAINVLHENSIVHRDIKGANIFLTSRGYLKLGDFGCSIKLKSHTTMPGEVNALVGTTAYMAPEVFTQNDRQGHGRAADIWSLGCVVTEMATGKHPWHELENNYQIMFRVGMGGTPTIPDTLSAEGKDFLTHCLDHEPKTRWTASQLQDHPFCKGYEEDLV